MTHVVHSDIDLVIDESRKEIIINPKGERFYFLECHQQNTVFTNATLHYDAENECYRIEGDQILYTEHKAMGFDYEKLLCLHPRELIVKKSFFGLKWYRVSGIMKRSIRSHYRCEHKAYRIHQRSEIVSTVCEER